MVRPGEVVRKRRKKLKSRNRSAAHRSVRLVATDRNDRREVIGTVQRIVLQIVLIPAIVLALEKAKLFQQQ